MTQASTRATPAAFSAPAAAADRVAGGHHVVEQRDVPRVRAHADALRTPPHIRARRSAVEPTLCSGVAATREQPGSTRRPSRGARCRAISAALVEAALAVAGCGAAASARCSRAGRRPSRGSGAPAACPAPAPARVRGRTSAAGSAWSTGVHGVERTRASGRPSQAAPDGGMRTGAAAVQPRQAASQWTQRSSPQRSSERWPVAPQSTQTGGATRLVTD